MPGPTVGRTLYIYSDGASRPSSGQGQRVTNAPGMVQTSTRSIFTNPSARFTESSLSRARRPRPLSFLSFKTGGRRKRPAPLLPQFRHDGSSDHLHDHEHSRAVATPDSHGTNVDHRNRYDMGWLLVRRTEARHQQAWKRNHDKHKHPKSGALSRRSSLLCKSIQCLILGLCFAVALTTYLAVALSGKYTLGTAANVLIILLLIFLATLFLHVLLRTVMHLHRQQNRPKKPSVHHRKLHRHHRTSRPQAMTDSATALATANDLPPDDSLYSPTTPVRVHLLRDANLAGSLDAEKEPSITASAVSPISPMSPLVPLSAASVEQTPQSADGPTRPSPVASPAAPPAYGLWRCSVRADPNLLHWVKVEEAERGRAGCEGRGRSAAAADPRDGTTCTVVGTRVHDGSEEGNTLHHEAGQSAQQVTSHTVLAHPSNHSSERPPSYVSGHLGGDGAARGEIVGGGSNDGCNARRDTGRG